MLETSIALRFAALVSALSIYQKCSIILRKAALCIGGLTICPAKSLLQAVQLSHCQLAMDLVVPPKLVATTCVRYETSRTLFCEKCPFDLSQSHRLKKFT